ncbi:MAG: beta-ketoacyl-ACP synthase II [Bacillota bacterium]
MARIVITGMGAVTPLGNSTAEFWEGLIAGRSGIAQLTKIEIEKQKCKIGAEVKNFDPFTFLDRKEAKRMDLFVQFAAAATMMALLDSGLKIEGETAHQTGVIIGSGIGGMQTLEDQSQTFLQKGPGRVSPFFIPMMIPDMASGQVSILTGAKGPNAAVVTACASASHSIAVSYELIKNGYAEVMITGGTEAAITGLSYSGFCAAGALSYRNDDPLHASRPFDAKRDGFVMGEGCGILILEALEHAEKRGARIYAEMIGAGMTGDAYHITSPDPEGDGAARAMAMALKNSGIRPEEVDYINAHGTSTPLNDKYETLAIKKVFGDHAYKVAISSTKSMTGHLLGAAGGIEAIAAILAIHHGIIPPTVNYEYPDPDCDLDYVPNQARKQNIKVVMSNSLGFGGHNASLVFRSFGK